MRSESLLAAADLALVREGIASTLIDGGTINDVTGAAARLLADGGATASARRRGRDVAEMPGVTVIEINDPTRNLCTLTGRRLNPWVSLAEFPWLMAGRNDVAWLLPYLPRAEDFSDDGRTWRAGYGPRLRAWGDAYLGNPIGRLDQLGELLRLLRRDPTTRRAVLGIWDPAVDLGADSKDVPCSIALKVERADTEAGQLGLTTLMRSNDLVWGFSGVNVLNFTLLQRLLAELLDAPLGTYTHVALNLHAYREHDKLLSRCARGVDPDPGEVETYPLARTDAGEVLSLDAFTEQCAFALTVLSVARSAGEPVRQGAWHGHSLGRQDPSAWLWRWAYFMSLHAFTDRSLPGEQWADLLREVDDPTWRLSAAAWLARRDPGRYEELLYHVASVSTDPLRGRYVIDDAGLPVTINEPEVV